MMEVSEAPQASDKEAGKCVATFQIGGMTCGACVETIERMLRQQTGIYSVSVALLAERAVVEYDPSQWTVEKIAEEIDDIGFEASVMAEVREDVQIFKVYGMTCASCTSAVERGVGSMIGVISCSVSLATEEARVEYDRFKLGLRDIVERIEDLGFDAVLSDNSNSTQLQSLSRAREIHEWWIAFLISFSFGIPVFLISMVLPKWSFARTILHWQPIRNLYLDDILCLALTIPVQFGIGKRFYLTSYKAISHHAATMDVLIILGTSASFTYSSFAMLFALLCSGQCMKPSTFFETSTMLITFVTFGRYLENAAKGRTSEALSKLISLTPSMATIYADGKLMTREKKIASELIQTGDYVKVLPGEKVAADGIVVRGQSTIDESMVTGEPRPVSKEEGSLVIGGTVNCLGSFDFLVTRAGKEASLGQIVRLVSEAQTSKAPIQAFADRVAGIFVPCVVLLGVLTFLFWMCISHLLNMKTLPDVFHQEGATPLMVCLKLCISVIVVACPCALGLSTPTAVMVGTGVGAQNGILIKGGAPLEASRSITHIIFDKTGTLTQGKLNVSGIFWNDEETKSALHEELENDEGNDIEPALLLSNSSRLNDTCVCDLNRRQVLQIVSAAESKSEHPLARAISNFIQSSIGLSSNVSINTFQSITGKGIECRVNLASTSTSHRVFIGSLDLLQSQGCKIDVPAKSFYSQESSKGKTIIFASIDGSLACALSLSDHLKADAKRCIMALTRMKIQCAIMTGDSEPTARAIAKQLHISREHVFAGMSPNGKRSIVVDLKEKLENSKDRGGVCFVGDGINDSPALAAATLGIAVGGGTEIAMEAASIVLMRDNLMDVPASLHLSRRIFRQIKLNYLWATGYNFIFVPLAMGFGLPWGIHLHPMMAGAAMAFSSVSVVLSSLTLKWWKRPDWLEPKDGLSSLNEPLQPMRMTPVDDTVSRFQQVFRDITSIFSLLLGNKSKESRFAVASQSANYESVPIEMA